MRRNERGEGRLATLFWLAVIAALVYAAWNVGPAYYANYDLKDRMVEICRTPKGPGGTDEKITEFLMKEVRSRELDAYIKASQFRIQTTEGNRKISLEYERELTILPGWRKIVRFVNDVQQPLIY